MDEEAQNYYITPPTIFFPEEGIKITVVGTDDEWTEQLSDDLEHTFPSVPMTFYHLDYATSEQWQWLYHMVETSDLVMVNVGRANRMEMYMSLLAHGPKVWYYVDKLLVDKDTRILLNNIGANVFNDSEQLHTMLRNIVGEWLSDPNP